MMKPRTMSERVSVPGDLTSKLFHLICDSKDCRLAIGSVAEHLQKFSRDSGYDSNKALAFVNLSPEKFVVKNVEGKQFVEARTSVELCDAFQETKARHCEGLHVCRFFLEGSCKFGNECKKPHSFDSPQTRALLVHHKLDNMHPEALKTLFRKVLKEKKIKHAASSGSGPSACIFYNKGDCKNGDKCEFLHVCQHYIDGDCTFPHQGCKRSHSFVTTHARGILAAHRLEGRNEREILSVLKINPAASLKSNSSNDDALSGVLRNGAPGGKKKAQLTSSTQSTAQVSMSDDLANERTEICGFNLRGKCSYGSKCNALHTGLPYQWQFYHSSQWRNVTVDDNQELEIKFCDHKVDGVKMKVTGLRYLNINFQTMRGEVANEPVPTTRCPLPVAPDQYPLHPPLRSRYALPRSRLPEFSPTFQVPATYQLRAPHYSVCATPLPSTRYPLPSTGFSHHAVDDRGFKLRRLTTISSVLAPSGHVFRTTWKWYWHDDLDQWHCYDNEFESDVTSDEIEQQFQSVSGEKKQKFSSGSNNYTLHFDNTNLLYQQNDRFGTKRDVRRRPAKYLDEKIMKQVLEDFKRNRQKTSYNSDTQSHPVPSNWIPIDPSEEFKVVDLDEVLDREEYSKVKDEFMTTMGNFRVKSVKRVQNPGLWEDYERRKSKISKKNSGQSPEERWLFHGTSKDIVEPICQQGFDWRLSGSKHGARYGKGTYFAVEASYSHKYSSKAVQDVCSVFMAKVIVGSYVAGSYETQRPPAKDPSVRLSPLHDSCVNDVVKPTIFVVFERSQAYPYYIIDYTK